MKIIGLLSCLLMVSSVAASAAGKKVDHIADDGTQRVDAIFSRFSKGVRPGCAVGVYRDGKVALEKGYGLASLEHGVAIDPRHTVFDLGSVGKQFTAASVLLLAQDGRLALDDDIRKHLPSMPDYGKSITIAHLLHHTSGLRDYNTLGFLAGWDEADVIYDEDAMSLIRSQKALNFAPGSSHSYSNTGYFLLSKIVERVSGKPLSVFARERIFAPLGMDHTFYMDDHRRVVPHRATGYTSVDDDRFAVTMSDWRPTGDGAVQSTLGDLAKWQRNFDEPTVGGRGLIKQLETRGSLNNGQQLEYARGLYYKDHDGVRMIGHDGSWAGYVAMLTRVPEERLSVAVLCNIANHDPAPFAFAVADVYRERKVVRPRAEPKPISSLSMPDRAAVSGLVGTYWNPLTAEVHRLELTDEKLWYVIAPSWRRELVPIGEGRWRMREAPRLEIRVKPVAGATPSYWLHHGAEPEEFRRTDAPVLDAKVLEEFAGLFSANELGQVRWHIAYVDGRLMIRRPHEPAITMVAVSKDVFVAERSVLRFERDRSGRPIAFHMDDEGVRGVMFERVAENRTTGD